jgi:squalene-hopene/tetraprenyl-beta-curcumene cyclase
VNYLYGTSAVLAGLLSVGVSQDHPRITDAVKWLLARQNADGGFGESSSSYHDKSLAGIGISTPTQTAWVMMALLKAGLENSEAVKRAAQYLVTDFIKNGKWVDAITVGTGMGGQMYIDYPSYPMSFPMQALGRYMSGIKGKN